MSQRSAHVLELHRAVHAVGLFLDARTSSAVTQPEALILAQLAEHGTQTMNDLHHAFLHRRSTLTSVVDRLETRGFVKRRPADGDRRSLAVELTRAGGTQARAVLRALDELGAIVERGRKQGETAAHATFLNDVAQAAAALAHAKTE
jgi:DNA-binding MarR family transcriptional regulator